MTSPPTPGPTLGALRANRLIGVLTDALALVDGARFDLDVPGAGDARILRDRVSTQVRTHLLPRLREVDYPAIIAFGGSTGAGKSTIVNSLVGREVSDADVLRPTTRRPVLVVNPADAAAMASHPIAVVVRRVKDRTVPAGIALLDTPDLDSVNDANRALGTQLIESADLWVFVTTATRYGDALPWATLQLARERGATIAVVLNRVSGAALAEVRADLLNRLVASDLGSAPLFVLPDLGPHEGLMPRERVADLGRWLTLVAGQVQGGIVARTVRHTWPSVRADLAALAAAVDAQARALESLERMAVEAIEPGVAVAAEGVASGVAAHGAPTTRWLALASAGGPLAPLVGGGRRVRARGAAARARSDAVAAVEAEVLAATRAMIVDAAEGASRSARAAWATSDLGASGLLARLDGDDAGRARQERAATALATWADGVAAAAAGWTPAPRDRAARLLDERGWVRAICAAAAGLDGAGRAVEANLGEAGARAVAAARGELQDRAAQVVRAEVDPLRAALAGLEGAADAATALRLRVSELKGVV